MQNQLLGDIINELMNSQSSIEGPLLKTKVLATRIGNIELADWANNELNGYKGNTDKTPAYRICETRSTMSYMKGGNMWQNAHIPTYDLDEYAIELLNKGYLLDSVTSLEAYANSDSDATLDFYVPSELIVYIQSRIRQSPQNRYFNLIEIRKEAPVGVAKQALSSVRSKLLDFMLELERTFGSEITIESLRSSKQQVNTIMYNTINANGDGNVINTGNQAKLDVTISINKGDSRALRDKLSELGVSQVDAEELIQALEAEPYDASSERFGPEVSGWVGSMISKALSGGWQVASAIGTGAIGGVLTELIKAYYGIGH